jgi:diguanylate cyclase (GGDEF)-like protein/PAS domain S-box-containing protein
LYANRRFAEMLRTPLEKVIGSEIHTWFAPDSRQVVQALLRKDVIGNRSEEVAFAAFDGTQVPVYLSVNHLLLEGAPDSFCMVATDLTEQKRSEAMLAAERLARAILEQAADAIIVCDETGRIIRASKQAQAFCDRNLIGQSFEHAFPLRLLDGTSFAPVDPIDSSKRHAVEARLERNGQRFDFLVSVGRLKGAGEELLGSVVTLTDITERKQASDQLRESERRFSDMLANVELLSIMIDRESKITYCNDYFLRLTGWQREKVLGQCFFELFLPHDLVDELRRVRSALLANLPEAWHYENEIVTRSGERKLIRWNNSVLRSGDGDVIGTASIGEDITERKRTELAAIRLAAIVESSEDAIIGKDLNNIVTSWNKGAENNFGFTESEMVGTSILRLIPSDRLGEEERILEKIKRGKSVEHFDTLRQTKDGGLIDVSVTTSPIKDATGKVIGISKLARDITERKHAERQLQESEAKFRHLIEQADDGIFISDAQGNFILVNSRGCELLGYTEEQLLGMNSRVTYTDGETEFDAERMQAVGAGNALRFERMVKRKDASTFPAEISVKMLDNGMVQVIFHDITVRRSQEKKISRLSRIHAVLSGINAAIVRIRDRTELFQQACRIIVEHGHFVLGWIAVLDHATGKLTAVAQAGLPASAGADSHLFDGSLALVPGGTAEIALKEERSAIDNAIDSAPGLIHENEPDTMKVRRAAIALGAKSVIVLPLVVEGETFGILTLYAPERDFFDDEEIKLLDDLASDISFGLEFIAKEEKADYLDYYDALTGLANRRLILERITQHMRSAVSGGHGLALFLIDLERFKNINDSLGRSAGDALLKQVAEWLTRNAGDASLLARVGADHFAVVLPKVKEEGDVARVLEKSMAAFLEHPFRLNDAIFRIGHKVGVALFPEDGADADTLFRHAEAALKKAKASGDRYLFYTQKMTEMVAVKLNLENQLRQALDKQEFVLHYQPKVHLVSGKLTGAEALIRWNDPRTGLVPPGRFIPILEETGLIHEVGRWALRQAIEDYLRWRSAGLAAVRIAVNVSPLQLRNRDFIDEIKQAIGIDARAAAGLELEITESLIMEDVKHNIASLQAIRAMGITIAIDDFGTGFSSLSHLSKLPVDTLKIDRSFVIDMSSSPEGLALVSTIITLGHSLELRVVAEGVETEEQSSLLRLLNCDEMQGYLFSRPVPGEIFESKFLTAMAQPQTVEIK